MRQVVKVIKKDSPVVDSPVVDDLSMPELSDSEKDDDLSMPEDEILDDDLSMPELSESEQDEDLSMPEFSDSDVDNDLSITEDSQAEQASLEMPYDPNLDIPPTEPEFKQPMVYRPVRGKEQERAESECNTPVLADSPLIAYPVTQRQIARNFAIKRQLTLKELKEQEEREKAIRQAQAKEKGNNGQEVER